MIGKVWTLITVISFITSFHHIHSKCLVQDLDKHLTELLMEDHVFKIKVFSSETQGSELLSVIDILCSSWTKNMNKTEIKVVSIFKTMLEHLDEDIMNYCATSPCLDSDSELYKKKSLIKLCTTHTCMDAYSESYVNRTEFQRMYFNSCSSFVSGLSCPSKNTTPLTTISLNDTAFESTTFLMTVSSTNTDQDGSITSSTAVTPNFTAPENQSFVDSLTTSSSPKESFNERVMAENQNLQTTLNTMYAVLAVSLLLNVFLFLLLLWNCKSRGSPATAEGNEMSPLCHLEGQHRCLSDGSLPSST